MPTDPIKLQENPVDVSAHQYNITGGIAPLVLTRDYRSPQNRCLVVRKWKWTELKQPGRKDVLKLYHWTTDNQSDEPVAHEHESIPSTNDKSSLGIPEFTDEEYDLHLKDNDWSREETRYLCDLCNQYDLRFFVIKDMYEFGTTNRTLEDLKDRFYTICRILMAVRLPPSDPETRAQIAKYHYDKAREQERKRHLLKLYSRTHAQIQEEELLYFELKKRELRDVKYNKERESALHTHSDHELLHRSAAAAAAAMGNTSSTSNELKKKRKSLRSDDAAGSGLASMSSGVAGHKSSGRNKRVTISTADLNRSGALDTPSSGGGRKGEPRSQHAGVYLRSSSIGSVRAALQPAYFAVLQEFDVPLRPVMATTAVVERHEQIRKNLIHLLELRKNIERLEQNLRLLEGSGVLPSTTSSTSVGGSSRRKTHAGTYGSVSPIVSGSPLSPEISASIPSSSRKRPLAEFATPRDTKRSRH